MSYIKTIAIYLCIYHALEKYDKTNSTNFTSGDSILKEIDIIPTSRFDIKSSQDRTEYMMTFNLVGSKHDETYKLLKVIPLTIVSELKRIVGSDSMSMFFSTNFEGIPCDNYQLF